MKLLTGPLVGSTIIFCVCGDASAQQRQWRECLTDEQTRTLTCIDYQADRNGQKRKIRGPYTERVPSGQLPPMFFDPPGSGNSCSRTGACE
jgi:hypothetical protein